MFRLSKLFSIRLACVNNVRPRSKEELLLKCKRSVLSIDRIKYGRSYLSNRFFHVSKIGNAKVFVDTENGYAHTILAKNSKYFIALDNYNIDNTKDIISENDYKLLLDGEWDHYTVENLVKNFKMLSSFSRNNKLITRDISGSEYDKMCQALILNAGALNFDQMCTVLQCLSWWPPTESSHSHNFKEVWRALDEACISNMKQWHVGQLLLLNDHWYNLNLAGINFFTWHSLNICSRKAARLSPPSLVQSLFYINLRRKFPPGIDFIDYQAQLTLFAEQLSIEELGICAMAFFKTQKKIRSVGLLKMMIEKTALKIDTIHPITLASILKVIRSSLPVELVDQLNDLLNKLLPRIPDLPLVCCLHIALAGSNIQLMHKPVITAVLDKFLAELPTTRLKDLERLAFVLSLFNWPPILSDGRNVYKLLAEEVTKPSRDEEIYKHPRCLTNLLNFLGMAGVYLQPQISKALNSSFVEKVYSASMQKAGQEVLSLDVTVQIECPAYSGHKLPQKARSILAKSVSQHPYRWQETGQISKGSAGDQMLKEMINVTSNLVKDPEMIFVGHILPNYFRPDILVRVSDTMDFLPIPENVRNVYLGDIRKPEGDGHWVTLILAGWNLLERGTQLPLGSLVQKQRLLRILGYIPNMIPWTEWHECGNKRNYMLSKIRDPVLASLKK